MGIVQRQSFWNSIWSYLGVGVAYLNKVYLFREFLTVEEYGLIELLLFWMVFGVELSQFGISRIVMRFFPYFSDHPKREGSFTFFVVSYMFLGFLVFVLCYYLFHAGILTLYEGNAPLFVSYLFLLVPLVAAYSLNKLFATISESLLKSVVPTFAEKFALRVAHSILLLVYLYADWSFQTLLVGYVALYGLPFLINLSYLMILGKLHFHWDFDLWKTRWAKILLGYGLYSLLADASVILVNRLDGMMLGMQLGEASVGAYALAFYLAAIIYIPARSLNAISTPLVSRHLRRKEYASVEALYQKTALNNLVVGGLFWILISTNIDAFFAIKDTFSQGRMACILLGAAILISVSTGINRSIIVNSRYYRFDLFNNLFMIILVIVGNYFLIPILRETGAALTTLFGMTLYNGINSWYVWRKFGIHPIVAQSLPMLAVLIGVFVLFWYMPGLPNPYWDILVRGTATVAVYGAVVWIFDLAPDLIRLVKGLGAKLSWGK